MTNQTPKAFDFGEEEVPSPDPAATPAVPKALDFGDIEEAGPAPPAARPPVSVKPSGALCFDDLPDTPPPRLPPKAEPRPLFDSEDHPAVRDAMSIIHTDYPALFAQSEQRMTALFRRILPVKLVLVTDWAEEPLMEQAALLAPITELVRKFSEMGVPALLEAALESTRPPTGVFSRFFNRTPPSEYKPLLTDARARLQQLMTDSEVATRNLDDSAKTLTMHWVALAVVSDLADGAADATLLDVLQTRRTLIQQAVRQAELSVLQMGQVRQQAAELIGQISSFLTVTLPAVEMAQTQGER